ncbi:class I SAM-dependent methyltransferase [Paenibacillus sp. GYB003]|uniref:class I SAM-dependent methyltransferase n=1 Tax=Paenibacillus sp. GYB003 TaxID=2994392 RepID=UPI002F96E430
MSYVLEHDQEFERLERQSLILYDYRKELRDVEVQDGALVLDAGCGSGVVSRYLANRFPASRVIGCDYTASLLAKARDAGKDIPNLAFEEQDLKQLNYPDCRFDLVLCRFVFQHQDSESLSRLVAELARVLKPGGTLVVIDSDGLLYNLYPQTPVVAEGLQKLAAVREIDLHVGRKIPCLLSESGLTSVTWRIENLESWGESRAAMLELMHARFRNASAFFERVLGGPEQWQSFSKAYLECMEHPQSVCFVNKFIVRAKKPL